LKRIVVSLLSTVAIAVVVGCAFNSKLSTPNYSNTQAYSQGEHTDLQSATPQKRSISSVVEEDLTKYNQFVPNLVQMVKHNRKFATVFWLTTCPYCTSELESINQMVISGQIPADSVLAVSIGEPLDTITRVVQLRGYRFKLALDPLRRHSANFQVQGTPTIFLIDDDGTVHEKILGTGNANRIKEFILSN
jgi:thiol-disulfide isomerase/thioredoxin